VPSSPLEALAVAFGFAYVVLVIRQNLWCWPAGVVNALLFVIVFFEARLYGATGLQVVYVGLMLYGWWQWRGGAEGGGTLDVSRMPRRWRVALAAAGTAGAIGLGLLLRYRTDAALPYWDGAATSFSLAAQLMTTRKWVENWYVWLAVDVVYIGMYVSQGLYPTAALYGTFLVLAALGLVEWRKALESRNVA
jgi:nicotinamide mononucleotide transporter